MTHGEDPTSRHSINPLQIHGEEGEGKYLFSHASIRGTKEELDANRFYENSEKS